VVSLSDAGAPSTSATPALPSNTAQVALITQFYKGILRRDPDSSGMGFWQGEIARVVGMGASANEAFYAMAMAFFTSAEYAGFKRDDAGFVADLYQSLYNRAADASGAAYWLGLVQQGMPREVALAAFMFSNEFTSYVANALGTTPARAEVSLAMDLYRGILGRLPDSGGFSFALQTLRTAQCQGARAVNAAVDNLTGAIAASPEYANRGRNNGQYVGDLYNAFLRRGGDLTGVQYWVGSLNGSSMSREQLRKAFLSSPEFQARVQAVIAAGCAG
jgi:hypothetical protein